MFKSSPTLKPSSPLRSSDRRKFIQNLQALYPSFKEASSVDVELIQVLVPEGLRQANTTTSAGYKAILYSHPNGSPLWFSFSTGPESGLLQNKNGSGGGNGKGKGNGNGNAEIESTPKVEIIPTVYTLWLFPSLLPRVNTWNKVVQVCLGGSSLMAPGLLPEPHTFHSSSTSTSISQSNGKDSIHLEEAESQSEEVSSYQPSEDYLSIQPGSLISIVSYPSSIPLIVARSELSHQEMSEMKIKGGKGKAARIIHCYKDHLWSITKKDPKDLEEAWGDKEAGLITQMGRLKVVSGQEWKILGDGEKRTESEQVEGETLDSSEARNDSEPVITISDSSASSTGSIESLNHIQDGEFSPSEVEEILKLSFLQTLSSSTFRNQASYESSSNTNSSSFFPLSSSTFYSTFLLPSRPITYPPIVIRPLKNPKSKPSFPPGTKFDQRKVGKKVDIKKSSSKKLAKFLKGLEKDGWIKTKERSGEVLILEVNFEHQDLRSFQPFLTISQHNELSSEASTKDPSNPTSTNTNSESSFSSTICKVSVDEFWSPSKATKPLFDEVGTSSDPSSLYTRSALRTVVQRYVNSKQLSVPSNMAFVRPDHLLRDCLWSSSKSSKTAKSNDSQSIPSEVKREELIEKLIKSCASSHRINRLNSKNSTLLSEIESTNSSSDSKDLSIPPNLRSPQDQLQFSSSESIGSIKKGDYSPILLSLKLRQGRKIVTLLTRLEDHGLDVKEISTEIMRAVGASTSLNELPGSNPKNQKWELLIQGDQRKFLLEGSNAFLRGKGIDVKRQVKVEDVKK